MRTVMMTLAAALVLVCGSGCLVASTTQHGVCGRSAVVWNDDIYVVDLKARKARRVQMEPCAESETIETIIIEEDEEARAAADGRSLASSR